MKNLDTSYTPRVDHSGKQFGSWTTLFCVGATRVKQKSGKVQPYAYYRVRCRCGYEKDIKINDLLLKKSLSCNSCSRRVKHPNHPKNRIGNKSHNWKGTHDIPLRQYTMVCERAKRTKKELNITIEDLQSQWTKQTGKCVYTGRALLFNSKAFKTQKATKDFHFASLDRIDSSKGYIVDNIQWVCQSVNIAKQRLSHSEFLRLISDIYKHSCT